MPSLDPFKDPLPIPLVQRPYGIGADGTRYYRMEMRSGEQPIHSQLPAATPFWGYEGLYPGPSIETPIDSKVVIEFVNALQYPWPFAYDTGMSVHHHAMHSFEPPQPWTVVHLHGSPNVPSSEPRRDSMSIGRRKSKQRFVAIRIAVNPL